MKAQFFYLLEIQYLGFRFHGWAKQPKVKTLHHMIDRTLTYVFDHTEFKTLGGSRTDAMVSANHFVFELFLQAPIQDPKKFLDTFNLNLPADIRALDIQATDSTFNIIQVPKQKEYLYLFAFGEKAHPFSAPFITTSLQTLDITIMQKGAKLFQGMHDFRAYCKKPSKDTQTVRSIDSCEIVSNTFYQASFFPSNSFALQVKGKGFMRNQIRMIMGQLFRLGKGQIDLAFIEASLKAGFAEHLTDVAPASGLILQQVTLKN